MKNIVICVDLTEESLKTLEKLQFKFNLNQSIVHLVHVFEIKRGMVEFTPVIYPSSDQYPEIENSVVDMLSSLSEKLDLNPGQVKMKCFFNDSKESCLKDYLKEINADLVVLATRGKHGVSGFFASSLTDFLCKYAPCDIFVMRSNNI